MHDYAGVREERERIQGDRSNGEGRDEGGEEKERGEKVLKIKQIQLQQQQHS